MRSLDELEQELEAAKAQLLAYDGHDNEVRETLRGHIAGISGKIRELNEAGAEADADA